MGLSQKKWDYNDEQRPETEAHCEIGTHHFNTVWLITGTALFCCLWLGGLSAIWLFHPQGQSETTQLCSEPALGVWTGGSNAGPDPNPSPWNTQCLGGRVEREGLVMGGKEKEHFPCFLCWLSRICGCSGLCEDALGHLYSYMAK